jgi:hypothetical protein
MFGLCLYTAFKMTTTISDKEFCRKYEKKCTSPYFRSIWPWQSLASLLNQLVLASSEIAAWSLQVGRRQSPELVGECEQEIEYVLPLAIMTSVGISFLYLLGIFCCMAIVYIYNLRGKRLNNPSSISSCKGSPASPDVNFDSSTMMPLPWRLSPATGHCSSS